MHWLIKSISVPLGSKAFRDNWDAVFGKRAPPAEGNCIVTSIDGESGTTITIDDPEGAVTFDAARDIEELMK